MVKNDDFIRVLQEKVAVTAVGPSALRGQGKGVLKAAQKYLAGISLERIPKSNKKRFEKWLDRHTLLLLDCLPVKNRPWGAARKAINLFLRDVLYNQYLNTEYSIHSIEHWLEIPLDSAVAKGLKSLGKRGELPQWPGLKKLSPDVSERFQLCASEHARMNKIASVHLDIYLWLANR